MRIESLGLFNPLCESKLVVTNRETVRQPVDGLSCKPCFTPRTADDYCCCNCFQVDGSAFLAIDPEDPCFPDQLAAFYDLNYGTPCELKDEETDAFGTYGCVWQNLEAHNSESTGIQLRFYIDGSALLSILFGGDFIGKYWCSSFSCLGGTFALIPFDDPDYPYTQTCGSVFPSTVAVSAMTCNPV